MNKLKTEHYILSFLLIHTTIIYGFFDLLIKVETINILHFSSVFLFSFFGLLSGVAMGSSRIEMCIALVINLVFSISLLKMSNWEYHTDPIKYSCLMGVILGLLYFSIFVFFEFIKANKKHNEENKKQS